MYTPSAISVPGKLSHINIYERRRIEMKEKANCKLIFLSPYSPDLNPIEHYWLVLKNKIRRVKDDFDKIEDCVEWVVKRETIGQGF